MHRPPRARTSDSTSLLKYIGRSAASMSPARCGASKRCMLTRYSGCHAISRLATGAKATGRNRRDQCGRAQRPRGHDALDDRGAHGMADHDRGRRQRRGDAFDVRDVIVQPRNEQRFTPAACTVTAQRQRMRCVAALGEPGEEVGLPAPRVAVAAVHEQQGRLAVASRGQPRANFEFEFPVGALPGTYLGAGDDMLRSISPPACGNAQRRTLNTRYFT